MSMLTPLVVGTDGSATAAAAVDWAVEHTALGEDLQVVVAHGAEARAACRLPALADGSEPITHVLDVDPSDALLEVAAHVEAGAIVVGSHGAGHSRHFLGATTRELLRRSPIPVIVIAPEATTPARPARPPVVACVGYGRASDEAAGWAADYAAEMGLPLVLVHVVGTRPVFPGGSPADTLASYFGPEVSIEWAQLDLESLREQLSVRQPDLEIATGVRLGPTVRSIQDASADAELVVLGKRRSSRLARATVPVRTRQVVARISAPVAVVPSS